MATHTHFRPDDYVGPQNDQVLIFSDPDGDGRTEQRDVFYEATQASMDLELDGEIVAGFADGIRCDVDGNIWASAGWVGDGYDGVHVFAPDDGKRIGQILLPEICSNVAFGGKKRNLRHCL